MKNTSKLINRNSRLFFINCLTTIYFNQDVKNINDLPSDCFECIMFKCDYDEEFFKKIITTYDINRETISIFAKENINLLSLEYAIICAACTEIYINPSMKDAIIKEYLQIADIFSAKSSPIHAKVDKFHDQITNKEISYTNK